MKFYIKDFSSKCDQIRSFLRIWSHLLEKSLMENFIFCADALAPNITDSGVVYLKCILEYFEAYSYLVLYAVMCYFCLEKNESIIFGSLIIFLESLLFLFFRAHHSQSETKYFKAI